MAKIDIDKINIFTNPKFMKVWAKQFDHACGSDTFNVAPNMVKLRFLMDKFVNDYNFHLEQLSEEYQQDAHVKDYKRMEEE
tara:strand:- start:275 stop:517 length:243 start_codon:yes stop_codon:yes gene_type:complete